jgi:hypothetical protein
VREGKRQLPRVVVLVLRGVGLAVLVGTLFVDLCLLHLGWHHFAEVERDAWISDYERLKNLIETQYPNLDWVVTRGGLDLNRLDARTTELLENARSAEEAERVLRDFVLAFHDGHMSLLSGDVPIGRERREDVTLSPSTPGRTACEALGYEEGDGRELELEFRGSASFRSLPDGGPFAWRRSSSQSRAPMTSRKWREIIARLDDRSGLNDGYSHP